MLQCPDVSTLPLLSFWDVYAGGISNIQKSLPNTPWNGTYGPLIDTGITPSGLLAHFYKSDKRQHGALSLSQAGADVLCEKLAHHYYLNIGEKHYALTPIQARGIPHGLVPGLHKVLDDYVAALESVRAVTGRAEQHTVDGLFALPFSAFTQVCACILCLRMHCPI